MMSGYEISRVSFIIISVRRFCNKVLFGMGFNTSTGLVLSSYCDRKWCCEYASCVVYYVTIIGVMVMTCYSLSRLIQCVIVRFGSCKKFWMLEIGF